MLWLLPVIPMLSGALLLAARPSGRGLLAGWGCGTMALTCLVAALALAGGWTGTLAWSPPIVLHIGMEAQAGTVALLVPLVALPVLLYAALREARPGLARLVGLLAFFCGAMELLVVAEDLVTLLIGWELVGACSWALIAHRWREHGNVRSAANAFLVTRFGDLGLFVAAAALFAGAGTFGYAGLGELSPGRLELVAAGIVLSAAAKSGQLPFSFWLFRAMDGPTPVSALLHAATMVAAGAWLLLRLAPALSQVSWFGPAVMTIGLATAVAGGIVGLVQGHAKKLLAASTSAHFGLMFVAVGAGYPRVALAHLVVHAFFKAGLFLAAGTAGHAVGDYRLHRMRLGRAMPAVAVLAGVCALALAGVPPLGGAWSKERVAAAAGHAGEGWALGVALAGALSAAYAGRFWLLAWGRPARAATRRGPGAPRGVVPALLLLAAPTVALSALWLPGVEAAAAALLGRAFPTPEAWELALSLVLVAGGLLAAACLVRRHPAPDNDARVAAVADWFGLPALARRAVQRPVLALAGALGRGDNAVVDAGVDWTARVTQRLGETGSAIGEWLADGLPEGAGRLVGFAGADLRRVQTGLSHQYYALIIGATALLIVILLIGA